MFQASMGSGPKLPEKLVSIGTTGLYGPYRGRVGWLHSAAPIETGFPGSKGSPLHQFELALTVWQLAS